jgi:hypothetical protein
VNKFKTILFGAALMCAGLSAACSGGGSTTTQQSGFKVQGEKYVSVFGGGYSLISVANVQGTHQFDNSTSAVGSVRSFGPLLCVGGPCKIDNGRVPARWRIFAGLGGECIGQITSPDMDVSAGQTKIAQCLVFGSIGPFFPVMQSVNLQAPPPSIELSGSGLDTTYGMPHLEYFDGYSGDTIGSADATAVSADGSWLQSPTPDLSGVYSGTYSILISNRQADGSLAYVGTASFDTYGRDGLYEPPPDPCQPGGGDIQPYRTGEQMEQPIDSGGCY